MNNNGLAPHQVADSHICSWTIRLETRKRHFSFASQSDTALRIQ